MPISNPPSGQLSLTIAETEVFAATAPGQFWTDIDLSSVVGVNLALVILKVSTSNTRGGTAFRKNGDTDDFWGANALMASGCALLDDEAGIHYVVLVATDANGVIEWKTGAAVAETIDIIGFIK